MDRFIARENIRHFCEMLSSNVEPQVRSNVHVLLTREEDKLGRDLETLVAIEKHVAECARRIEAQNGRVRAMQADGHLDLGQAQALLDGMLESQRLLLTYHQHVVREIDRNRLLDR